MFDPKCYEIAEHFLPSAATQRLKDDLAQHVQDAVEDWIQAEEERLATALAAAPN